MDSGSEIVTGYTLGTGTESVLDTHTDTGMWVGVKPLDMETHLMNGFGKVVRGAPPNDDDGSGHGDDSGNVYNTTGGDGSGYNSGYGYCNGDGSGFGHGGAWGHGFGFGKAAKPDEWIW